MQLTNEARCNSKEADDLKVDETLLGYWLSASNPSGPMLRRLGLAFVGGCFCQGG